MTTIKNIVRNISEQDLSKLEIDDSFEIELDGEVYYTLLDMEDGNYIAADANGRVFRMHHDSYEPLKEIYKSIDSFLQVYNGDKDSLADLFN